VIPPQFDYTRAETVEEALSVLAEHGDDAKVLAGGHSLIPLLKLRLASPMVLVDVGQIADLSYIREDGDHIAIGAGTTHHAVATSELLRSQVPLLAHATGEVGDPQVRSRGTLGGALAHGDPAADHPATLLALRGSVVIQGPSGRREIAADDLFTGFLETAINPDELLVEVRVPKMPGAGWSFQKFNRRAQDWAIVGVAAVVDNGNSGVALVNMGSAPQRAAAVEAALSAGSSAADAAAVADEGFDPPNDLNANEAYRRHLAKVLVGRALAEAGAS
jgi:carbon-monoxide dehydrogenase medium subunit